MLIPCISQQYLKEDEECRKERRSCFSFRSSLSLEHLEFSVKRRSNRFFTFVWCSFSYYLISNCRRDLSLNFSLYTVSSMGTKMKGIYKGFKYISQIFVVKEREMEIGYPTDVKHVAHIGWDGPSGSAPTWMNEFKTGPDFASTSIGNSSAISPWSSQDYGDTMTQQSAPSEIYRDGPSSDNPKPKKHRRRKNGGSASSPRSGGSSSRSSRAVKSKAKLVEGSSAKPINIEMA